MESPATSAPEVKETVKFLRDLGLSPLPVVKGKKVTYCKGYDKEGFVSPYDHWDSNDINVGLLMTEAFKVVDIDIDDPRITQLAVAHLPQTTWKFGRPSKKTSHLMFCVSDDASSQQSQRESDPKAKGYMDSEKITPIGRDPAQKGAIIEFRGHVSQTVMPGSLHESGERVVWDDNRQPEGLPPAAESVELRRAMRKIAFTAMVGDYAWHDHMRHDVTLCLAGMMIGAKWTVDEAVHWFAELMNWTGKGDRRNVVSAVRDTFKRSERGETRLMGGPRLAEITSCPELVTMFRHNFMDQREAVFDQLDSRYALAVYFSKVQVIDFDLVNDLSKPDFEVLAPTDFQTLMSNRLIKVPTPKGPRPIPWGKFWMEHPRRKTFMSTDFMPGMPQEVNGVLNLWRGWAAVPDPSAKFGKWLDHVRHFVCGEDENLYGWLIDWLADIVQNPMRKPGTAFLMRSGQRTGKNTLAAMLQRMIGLRYCREMNTAEQVANRFNSHFQHSMLALINEADISWSRVATNTLKTLVSDPLFHMDHKHGHAKTGYNWTRVILSSNKERVIERDHDDFRYTVVEVVNPRDELDDQAYRQHFNDVWHEIENGGANGLLHMLQTHEYDPDGVKICHESDAGKQQKLMSMDAVAQWWAAKLSDGRIPVPEEYAQMVQCEDGSPMGWPMYIGKSALHAAFVSQWKLKTYPSTAEFFRQLYNVSGIGSDAVKQIGSYKNRYRAIKMPGLDHLIGEMNKRYPGAVDIGEPVGMTEEDRIREAVENAEGSEY